MDDVTQRVRSMYERYPYPTRPRGVVSDVHPRLLLSYLDGPLPARPLRVLDAGCGTGSACLGTALCNPDLQVTAIDMNRAALEQVRAEATELGLANLQVCEADLMTGQGLAIPEGGFDVIFCSGVLHHLSDPARGLELLVRALAPRGVLRLMVYGTLGRHGLYRLVEALDALHPDRLQLEERLRLGRKIAEHLSEDSPVSLPPWQDIHQIDDVEFVDRYLNLNDRSYLAGELLDLVEGAGLRHVRWYEPRHWSLDGGDPELRALYDALPPRRRWALMERLTHRTQLDLMLSHADATDRRPPRPRLEFVALSPQVALRMSVRSAGGNRMVYHPTATLREGAERSLAPSELGLLEAALPGPVPAAQFDPALVDALLAEELLYRPV